MAWTKTLNKGILEWKAAAGGEYLTHINDTLVHTGDKLSQLLTSCNDLNKSFTRLRIRIKYAINDDTDILKPHDNPMRHKVYVTLNLFPMQDPDGEEPEQLYFQHFTIPAAQSYYKATSKAYAIADVTVPVDYRHAYTKRMVLNMYISRPCTIYVVSVKGEYEAG